MSRKTPPMPLHYGRALPTVAIGANAIQPVPDVRSLAHLGDTVYEQLVREIALIQNTTGKVKDLHRLSTRLARATFQTLLLDVLLDDATDEEKALVKRARNVSVSIGRRNDQALHRRATAFEGLVGHWYLYDPSRLQFLKECLWKLAHLSDKELDKLRETFTLAHDSPPSPKAKQSPSTPPKPLF